MASSLKRNKNLTEGLSPGVISDSHRRSWPVNFYGPKLNTCKIEHLDQESSKFLSPLKNFNTKCAVKYLLVEKHFHYRRILSIAYSGKTKQELEDTVIK